MPTITPIKTAAPPIKNILKPLLIIFILEIFAPITPRKNKAKRDKLIENQTASPGARIRYGNSGISPAIR